jgi:hypothetical protein
MKRIAKAAVFLSLCAALLLLTTKIYSKKFTNDNCQSYMVDELYQLEQNSVEVVFCGSSQVVFGVSGMELYERYGISAYSTGSPNQPILCSLGWLREIDKTQDIKVCVLDTSQLMEIGDESSYRQSIDLMHLSTNKWDIVQQHVQETKAEEDGEASDSLLSYLFPLLKYHTRWDSLTKQDFCYSVEDSPLFRGNYPANYTYSFSGYSDLMDTESEDADNLTVKERQKNALVQMKQYCEENGIALLLIKTPKADWTESRQKNMQELAEELELPYLDYATEEGCQELGLDFYTDFKDPQHLNLRGADKLSDAVGAYLEEHYDLTDFRETAPMDDAVLEEYETIRRQAYFKTEGDVVEFLTQVQEDYLSTGDYDLVLTLNDDAICDAWTDEMQAALAACGIQTDISQLKGKTYVASVVGGTAEEKTSTSKELTRRGTLSNGGSWKATSTQQTDRLTRPEIETDGTTTEFAAFGLNLVLYNSTTKEFAAQTAIALCPDGTLRANLEPER